MPWTSLSSRLSTLPLVLAGPIVRKTTPTSVSVWIALKETASLELVIKSYPTLSTIASASNSTRAFGRNLHIAIITVSGLSLLPNTLYHYDINFPGSKTFVSQGILDSAGGVSRIVYGGHPLPSFMLPSDDMSKLKLLHCSCRKPHGGVEGDPGKDAFEAVSILLDRTHNDVNQRPQQIFMTGDQIYADDVSDLLLFMLRDAENTLLGWTTREEFPVNPDPAYPMHVHLSPLHRLPMITHAGFTSGEAGKSHLLRLGEFYSMYLFVWSDVLWPANDTSYPSFESDYSYATEPDADYFDIDDEDTQAKYNLKKRVLTGFKETLPLVRRLLANISSYMIFDDHEVTDDWFLNKPWTDRVFGNLNGRRFIQNGLSSYAVFQGWGNKPEAFGDPARDENRLLNALVALNQHGESGASQTTDWQTIHDLVIPSLTGNNLTGGIDWSYSQSFNKFNFIVLNTRTNRALFTGYAGLMSNAAIQSQITDRVSERLSTHAFTLVLAPAPVFGLPLMEDFVQPLVTRFTSTTVGDYEPWSADRNKFEHFLKEIAAFQRVLFLSGDVHYAFSNAVDYWDSRTGAEVRSKFVNLTTSALKNSKNGPPDGTTFLSDIINNHVAERIVHLENDGVYVGWTSPNSPGSEYIFTEERDLVLADLLPINESSGRISVNRGSGAGIAHWHHLLPYMSYHPPARRAIARRRHEMRQWVNPATPPQWEYKIVFESDFRSDSDRVAGAMPTLSSSSETTGTASRHGALATTRANHTLVGHNNIGEIAFQWGAGETDKKIIHRIWSRVGTTFLPFTVHLIDFGIASAADQKPSEIGRVP